MVKDYNVYIVVGVAVLAILVIGLNGTGLTGNATKGSCSDDDPDQLLSKAGTVTVEHRSGVDEKKDECLKDGKHLRQWWCPRPNRVASVSWSCPKGCVVGEPVCNP